VVVEIKLNLQEWFRHGSSVLRYDPAAAELDEPYSDPALRHIIAADNPTQTESK
jgi:hypothetical protein